MMASASFFISTLAGVVDLVCARREQHFRLEHETVADDADVLAIGQDFAQPAEEIRPVAVELLHALRQRDVQAPAEVGDLGVGFAVACFRGVERLFERADLLAQRRDLLVEQFDLRQRALADCRARWSRARSTACRCGRSPQHRSRRPATAAARSRDCSLSAASSDACRLASWSCEILRVRPCSSASSCVSSLICELRRFSTSSLPEISRLRRNCASTNTDSRNMMDSSRVDSASTKPGQ